jgi:hypothetical protein
MEASSLSAASSASSTLAAPSRIAAWGSIVAGSGSKSTSTNAAASQAAVSLSAITAATGWPTKKTRPTANGFSGLGALRMGRSAPVTTSITPAVNLAAAVSMPRILALGRWLSTSWT